MNVGLSQLIKRAAFRWPILRDVVRPRYSFNIAPMQLCWLAEAINDTRNGDGCIVEVGVARGMTSTFLLEQMRRTGDERTYYCIDTFSGFVREHAAFEVSERGKKPSEYRAFSYGDAGIFA